MRHGLDSMKCILLSQFLSNKADGRQTSYGIFTYTDGTTTTKNGGGTYGAITTFCMVDNKSGSNKCYGVCMYFSSFIVFLKIRIK